MDPTALSNWLVAIEEYFDWYEMNDSERVRFAKMKLTNSAKMYWQNVLQYMFRLCHTPIPGPTRLADPNRVRSARTYTETLYLLNQTLIYPSLIIYQHIIYKSPK